MYTFRFLILSIPILLCSACSRAQNSQTDQDPNPFIQEKLNDHLYVLKAPNYNTNVGVFVGMDAIVLIDPMTGTDNHSNLLNKIKELSDKPIKYVLNTHSHSDHSGANKFFSDLGATIISHENAAYSKAFTDVTFDRTYTVALGDETIELFHISAHTIDDAIIYFTKSNVVFMGDTYMTNSYPHFYYGGGSVGHTQILDKALALGDERTLIVPAHGVLSSNKMALLTYKQNSHTWMARIKELYSQKKTVEEIIKDPQIKQLSTVFNGNPTTSINRLKQTIEKTISSDLVVGIDLPASTLRQFQGKYGYDGGEVDAVILLDTKLYLYRQGYMFELIPLSKRKFHVRGQAPHRNVTFNLQGKVLVYFDGKESRVAKFSGSLD